MDKTGSLQTAITEASIRRLSGDTYFKRGADYCRRDLVDGLVQAGDVLTATVRGTEDYDVRLSASGRKITHFCSCPLGDEGQFCKHLVATALAWLAGSTAQVASHDNVRAALQALDKETLIDLILELSSPDDSAQQKISARSVPKRGLRQWIEETEKNLKAALRVSGGYVDYNRAPVYASRVHSALDSLEELLPDHASAVIPICEAAMSSLSKTAEKIDDSDGQMTELMGRVGEMHLLACAQVRPDPERLGVRLFALEMGSQFREWDDTANIYAHVLGEAGLAAFRREAEKVWEKVPVRTERDVRGEHNGYYGITRIMESFARQSGDIEQIVAVLERDLTSPYLYLKIAEIYLAAGQNEKALQWTERGMAAFPSSDGSHLRLFAAQEYRRTERHAEALHLVWAEFRASPQLDAYRRLEDFARHADDWENPDGWRDRAIAYIRRTATENSPNPSWQTATKTWLLCLLVEIFLYEGDVAQAWAEAKSAPCSNELWLALAARREKTHPEDAVPVYMRIATKIIELSGSNFYDSAIVLLEKAAILMHGLGRSPEFQELLEELRLRHKAKSKLRKLVEARQRFLYLN